MADYITQLVTRQHYLILIMLRLSLLTFNDCHSINVYSLSSDGTGIIAGLLCYVLGWITGIVFLLVEKDNKFVRFHAWQSIITFGFVSVASFILNFIPLIGTVLGIVLSVVSVIIWVVLMIKAYQGQMYKLPVAGDIAEKQVQPKA